MKFISSIVLIAFLILGISFIVSHFNSEDGVLGSIKNQIYKFKLEKEIEKASSTSSLLKLSQESEKISNPVIKNSVIIKAATRAKNLSVEKEDKEAVKQQEKNKPDEPSNESKKENGKDDYKKIIKGLADGLARDLQKLSEEEKDNLVKSAYKSISENGLSADFEKVLEDNNSQILKDLYTLNKIASLLKSGQGLSSQEILDKLNDKELLSLLALLKSDLKIPEEQRWLEKLESKTREIKQLVEAQDFYQAKLKMLDLKDFLKRVVNSQ